MRRRPPAGVYRILRDPKGSSGIARVPRDPKGSQGPRERSGAHACAPSLGHGRVGMAPSGFNVVRARFLRVSLRWVVSYTHIRAHIDMAPSKKSLPARGVEPRWLDSASSEQRQSWQAETDPNQSDCKVAPQDGQLMVSCCRRDAQAIESRVRFCCQRQCAEVSAALPRALRVWGAGPATTCSNSPPSSVGRAEGP